MGASTCSSWRIPFYGDYERAYLRFFINGHTDEADAFRGYLKDLWTVFSVVNALLVSTSITPFSALPDLSKCKWPPSWQQIDVITAEGLTVAYGIFWTLAIGFNCAALLVSCLCLGSLLAFPPTEEQMKEYWTASSYYTILPLYFTVIGAVCILTALSFSAAVLHCMHGAIAAGCVVVVIVAITVTFPCAMQRKKAEAPVVIAKVDGKEAAGADEEAAGDTIDCLQRALLERLIKISMMISMMISSDEFTERPAGLVGRKQGLCGVTRGPQQRAHGNDQDPLRLQAAVPGPAEHEHSATAEAGRHVRQQQQQQQQQH